MTGLAGSISSIVKLRVPSLVAVVIATFVAPTGLASAQGVAPPRTPQGLFGGIRPDANATKRLDLTLSLVEGYDDDVPKALQSTVDPTSLQSGGLSTIVNAGAGFAWRGERVEVGANAASALRHYAELGETRSVGHSAGLGMSARLPGRATLLMNQAAAYSPTYLYSLFPTGASIEPGDAATTTPDYSVSDFESYSYTTTMTLRHDLTRRNSVSAAGEFAYTDRLRETALWSDISSYNLRGEYSQGLGRNASVTAEYRYRSGKFGYGGDGITTEMGVSVGVNYTRPLSATRRASVRFNLGSSGTDLPESATNKVGFERQYRAVGDVGVDYQFGRTWQARANLRRGMEYLADLPVPVFADGVGAAVDGLISRRVDVSASAGYSNGESALSRDSLRFDTYTGNLRVRYALSRTFAMYGEYLYYYYDFRGSAQLLAGIPPGLERNGVRAGLTLWVPALRR